MSISQTQRFELQLELQKVLRDDMANILMEHLPPSGWSDVARRQDLEMIELRLEGVERRFEGVDRRFEGVDRRFDEMERRFDYMDRRINILDGRMKLMITGILGFGLALLAIQVQLSLSIADLSSKVSSL